MWDVVLILGAFFAVYMLVVLGLLLFYRGGDDEE